MSNLEISSIYDESPSLDELMQDLTVLSLDELRGMKMDATEDANVKKKTYAYDMQDRVHKSVNAEIQKRPGTTTICRQITH